MSATAKSEAHQTNGRAANGNHGNGELSAKYLKVANGKAANGKAANGHQNGATHKNGDSHNGKAHASPIEGMDFLRDAVQLILRKAVEEGLDEKTKVVEFLHPAELERQFPLSLSPHPASDEDLTDAMKDIIKYSVKTGHPHFFNQLFGGFNAYGLTGAWLTDALNASQYTYEVSPVFTLMEKTVFAEMRRLIGFPDGEGDAIFCPGGSISNMYGINLARYQKFPDMKRTGMSGLPPLCILTSEKGHYSVKKGAAFLGIGMDNVFSVKTDAVGRMIPEELDATLDRVQSEGYVPILVNATAGSTVMGAYDPLNKIADICEKRGIWMHVDAAWGGGVLLSDKLRSKMAGVERADSVTWNPHKMMGAPLQASIFFTSHKNLLSECNSAKAKYLFQQDKFYDVSYDTGDKSIQCGRKVDILKLWMMWKAKGSIRFGKDIEHIFDCASYLTKKLASTDGFRLVIKEPECTNVTFWYIPPSLRGKEENAEWWEKLSQVAPLIKQAMVQDGTLLIGYQPDGDLVNFFRMVIPNHNVKFSDMDFVVEEIDRLGRNIKL